MRIRPDIRLFLIPDIQKAGLSGQKSGASPSSYVETLRSAVDCVVCCTVDNVTANIFRDYLARLATACRQNRNMTLSQTEIHWPWYIAETQAVEFQYPFCYIYHTVFYIQYE